MIWEDVKRDKNAEKKHKKKKKEKEVADFTEFTKECHESKWVKAGDYKIFCSKRSDYDDHLKELDIYFGLDDSYFRNQVKSAYLTPLANSMQREIIRMGKLNDSIQYAKLVVFPIKDTEIDKDVVPLITGLLRQDKRVGMGCIGGHGRTGWVLAKLIEQFEGITGDMVIKEVRKRLCKECIESKEQIKDLGGKEEKGKSASFVSWNGNSSPDWSKYYTNGMYETQY